MDASSPSRRDSLDSSMSREERLRLRLEMKKAREENDDDDGDGDSQDGDSSSKADDSKQDDDNESKIANMATPIKSNKSPANKSSSNKSSLRSLFPKRLSQLPKPGYIRGISQRQTGVWEARCYIDGKRTYLGRFSNKDEAMEAIREAGADDFKPEYQEELAKLWSELGAEGYDDETVHAENDEDTDGTAEKNDDITSKTDSAEGKGAADDSSMTDGSIELEAPRTKYFPLILYQMINDSSESSPEILEWLPCGSAFRINDQVS